MSCFSHLLINWVLLRWILSCQPGSSVFTINYLFTSISREVCSISWILSLFFFLTSSLRTSRWFYLFIYCLNCIYVHIWSLWTITKDISYFWFFINFINLVPLTWGVFNTDILHTQGHVEQCLVSSLYGPDVTNPDLQDGQSFLHYGFVISGAAREVLLWRYYPTYLRSGMAKLPLMEESCPFQLAWNQRNSIASKPKLKHWACWWKYGVLWSCQCSVIESRDSTETENLSSVSCSWVHQYRRNQRRWIWACRTQKDWV